MQIVIEIDEYDKEWIHNAYDIPNEIKSKIVDAIENGTPLPEHHSDLIDRMTLSDHIKNRMIQTAMNNMETILPYSKVCEDIVDNRIDTWIDEVKTVIDGSDAE